MTPPRMSPRGMTLVEMLVATTCTLLLMAAIAQVFGAFGTAVSDSRSMIELDARLRSTAWRLRSDLAGATARTLPPLEVEAGEGYLEIIEGPRNDSSGGGNGTPLAPADTDDAILFTTRNTETPFIGRFAPTTNTVVTMTESQLAEVGWFLRPTDTVALGSQQVPTFTLFRRQLLVVGYVGTTPFYDPSKPVASLTPNAVPWSDYNSWAAFFDRFDLSVQAQAGAGVPLPILLSNTLADLTRRETRFMHNPGGSLDKPAGAFIFAQHAWQTPSPPNGLIFDRTAGSTRVGEDVVLTNVLAFDIRVFDPSAPVSVAGDSALVPGDAGLAAPVANGAFVDLGWNRGPFPTVGPSGLRSRFADVGEAKSGLRAPGGPFVWDTWSTHAESNGVDDDGDGLVDQGSNGIDDDGDGKVDESPFDADGDGLYTGAGDDPGELETLPPYRFPLRGIEIRLRCYEPSSRQVRQVTVRHSFVPR